MLSVMIIMVPTGLILNKGKWYHEDDQTGRPNLKYYQTLGIITRKAGNKTQGAKERKETK